MKQGERPQINQMAQMSDWEGVCFPQIHPCNLCDLWCIHPCGPREHGSPAHFAGAFSGSESKYFLIAS